jgi:hypothetical protein
VSNNRAPCAWPRRTCAFPERHPAFRPEPHAGARFCPAAGHLGSCGTRYELHDGVGLVTLPAAVQIEAGRPRSNASVVLEPPRAVAARWTKLRRHELGRDRLFASDKRHGHRPRVRNRAR